MLLTHCSMSEGTSCPATRCKTSASVVSKYDTSSTLRAGSGPHSPTPTTLGLRASKIRMNHERLSRIEPRDVRASNPNTKVFEKKLPESGMRNVTNLLCYFAAK